MWGKILAFFIVLGLAILCAFIAVDQNVGKNLRTRGSQTVPALYSEPLKIISRNGLNMEQIKTVLLERRYRLIDGSPKSPGDFTIQGKLLSVYTREFTTPEGKTKPAVHATFNAEDGKVSNTDYPDANYFYVEPSVISLLGSNDQVASSFTPLKNIPTFVKDAVLAIEDERFYDHYGVDPIGIMRAMVTNLRQLSFVQGGSTITQQLAKNLLFTPRKTIGRKFMEMLAAISIERHLSKDQILEMYINEVYLGQEGPVALHGFEEASSSFFGKKISDLSISEAALLAGIIKAPSFYSPTRHLERAIERRDLVLEKMLELGTITKAQRDQAVKFEVQIISESKHKRSAPFFVAALDQELEETLNIDAALLTGLRVFTGINPDMQNCAEKALFAGIEKLETRFPKIKREVNPLEGALVAIEPHSGLVRAWVGGRSFEENQFNRVNQGQRQIGSTIKPFLYLTALDPNLNSYRTATAISVLSDAPMQVKLPTSDTWEPENFDHKYHGDVTLRYALENSLNMPAVYVSQKVGLDTVAKTIGKFHLASEIVAVPSLALGALDTNLLDLTAAYAALANGGNYVAPRLFISALDSGGDIMAASHIEESHVADENAVFVLTNILQGVIQRGTGHSVRELGFNKPAAGKTGTSNDTRDAWFVGFTPDLAAGVWIGFDNNDKVGLTGGVAAAPIWAEFMKCVAPFHEDLDFLPPSDVVLSQIDTSTKQLATSLCPPELVSSEYFIKGTEPLRSCKVHGGGPEDVPPNADQVEQTTRPEKRRRKSFWEHIFGD